ncbi:MAG: glycosyltransferase [Candidatus Stahlbacteria bacterium]|nr:glycosyltransferase [Candidatus Stahlbacteria bacterium]
MTVSIIIPSNKRHDKLQQCLLAIGKQILLPNEVIIIFAESDRETDKMLERIGGGNPATAGMSEIIPDLSYPLHKVPIKDMSSLAIAINYGLKVAVGDIVVFTDDDAIPDSDWLLGIVNTYKQDSSIGGVGGRDIVYLLERSPRMPSGINSNPACSACPAPAVAPVVASAGEAKEIKAKKVKRVGRLTLLGRVIGNHHQIVSKAQEVNFLKGCNMSVRRKLISLVDENILSHPRWEWDLCFQVVAKPPNAFGDKLQSRLSRLPRSGGGFGGGSGGVAQKGYKLIYDPNIQVKHFRTANKLTARDLCFLSHNTTYILLKYLSWPRRIIFIVYTFLIGQRNDFGLVRSTLLFFSAPSMRVIDITYTCLVGKIKGMETFFKKSAFYS